MVENLKKGKGISPRAFSVLENSKRCGTNDTSRLIGQSREDKDSLQPYSFRIKRKSYVPDTKGTLMDDVKN
jgi:hypothetical protein